MITGSNGTTPSRYSFSTSVVDSVQPGCTVSMGALGCPGHIEVPKAVTVNLLLEASKSSSIHGHQTWISGRKQFISLALLAHEEHFLSILLRWMNTSTSPRTSFWPLTSGFTFLQGSARYDHFVCSTALALCDGLGQAYYTLHAMRVAEACHSCQRQPQNVLSWGTSSTERMCRNAYLLIVRKLASCLRWSRASLGIVNVSSSIHARHARGSWFTGVVGPSTDLSTDSKLWFSGSG